MKQTPQPLIKHAWRVARERAYWWIVLYCLQAVCVTTHKGSWAKLFMCLISIVTRSSSHLVREIKIKIRDQNTASFSEKHYGGERFGEFSGSHTGLRCLLLASQGNFNKFIAIRRQSKPVRFYAAISCFSEDFMYCLMLCLHVYFYLRRVWKRSVAHTWICLNKKFVHLIGTFDGL